MNGFQSCLLLADDSSSASGSIENVRVKGLGSDRIREAAGSKIINAGL
jgi:hypothetical protein